MLTFTAAPRDGTASAGSACLPCCCQSFSLTPGETNKIAIIYAPWSVPIGGHGLVGCGTEFNVEKLDTCPQGSVVDGFGPPDNQHYSLETATSTMLTIDVAAGAAPAGNSFAFRAIPFSGPLHGVVMLNADGTGEYAPFAGYTGWDWFWFETKDAQGRSIIRKVTIKVGAVIGAQPPIGDSLQVPAPDKVSVNQAAHTIEFPITMPFSARQCETYRLTVRQTAMDCDRNCYTHTMCFDVSVGKC